MDNFCDRSSIRQVGNADPVCGSLSWKTPPNKSFRGIAQDPCFRGMSFKTQSHASGSFKPENLVYSWQPLATPKVNTCQYNPFQLLATRSVVARLVLILVMTPS